MDFTEHAQVRCQQRAVPPLVVDLLMRYGAENRLHGATRYFLDKEARRRLSRAIGDQVLRRLEDLLDTMIVVGDDGRLITAAHRTKRMRR